MASLSAAHIVAHIPAASFSRRLAAAQGGQSLADLERDLLELLDYSHFALVKELIQNRLTVVWCTRLARAQDEDEERRIEARCAITRTSWMRPRQRQGTARATVAGYRRGVAPALAWSLRTCMSGRCLNCTVPACMQLHTAHYAAHLVVAKDDMCARLQQAMLTQRLHTRRRRWQAARTRAPSWRRCTPIGPLRVSGRRRWSGKSKRRRGGCAPAAMHVRRCVISLATLPNCFT